VRLYTRNGNDSTKRFSPVVAALATLPLRSCLIDGEAIASDDSGLAVFDLIRSFRHDLLPYSVPSACSSLTAFPPTADRGPQSTARPLTAKAARVHCLERMLRWRRRIIFEQACKLGCEGNRVETARLNVPLRPLQAPQSPQRRW
jgi:hypothetical protein